jgi:hypothetical protein
MRSGRMRFAVNVGAGKLTSSCKGSYGPSTVAVGPSRHIRGSREGYTEGMKTAISLPDDLYEEVERLASNLSQTRSQLYRAALEEYLARHEPDRIRESLDRLAAETDDESRFRSEAARRALERAEW